MEHPASSAFWDTYPKKIHRRLRRKPAFAAALAVATDAVRVDLGFLIVVCHVVDRLLEVSQDLLQLDAAKSDVDLDGDTPERRDFLEHVELVTRQYEYIAQSVGTFSYKLDVLTKLRPVLDSIRAELRNMLLEMHIWEPATELKLDSSKVAALLRIVGRSREVAHYIAEVRIQRDYLEFQLLALRIAAR